MLKNNLIFLFVFLFFNTTIAQKDARDIEYYKTADMNINNDSLSNYIKKLKQNLQSAKIENDTIKTANNSLFIGMIYFKIGYYEKAMEYCTEALNNFEELNDTLYMIHSLQLLGGININAGNNIIGIKYSKRNIELCKTRGDSILMLRAYYNLGASYSNLGKLDIGIRYINKALKYVNRNLDNHKLIRMYQAIGNYYLENNQLDSSSYYLKKSLSLIKDKNNTSITALLYSNIAKTEYLKQNHEKALFYSKESIKYNKNKIMTGDANISYQILIKSMLKLGKDKNVLPLLDSLINVYDEIILKKRSKQLVKMKILYEVDKYETEIKLLSKENKLLLTENELRESKIIASKQKLYFAGFIIFATLLIMVIIIIQNSRLKKTQKKIVEENVKSLKFEEENIQLQKVISKEQKVELELSDSNSEKDQNSLLFSQAVSLLENEKLYKNPELKMSSLAKRLDTNTSYLSKAINSVSNKSFSEFVNEYRVAEAKKMLFGKESELLTIEAIGKKAGFNSKTTFFRVFKSIAGVTPNFFLNNIKEKN